VHGIPNDRAIPPGDLVNVERLRGDGRLFRRHRASFAVPPVARKVERLCRDGRREMWAGLREVGAGEPLASIGRAVGAFARKNGYTLVRNLARHGVGRPLHEQPTEIATWPNASECRVMENGLVLTVEPFLSVGAEFAEEGHDPWTLYGRPGAFTVQYEHTVVATRNGLLVVTLAWQ
jgi:methionyl aminopeptidase